MELWIPITIAAAFLQNLRSALQKHLQGSLGTLFAVCANEWSPDDGKVVSLDHGCGAHSETDVEPGASDWPAPDPLLDENAVDVVERDAPVAVVTDEVVTGEVVADEVPAVGEAAADEAPAVDDLPAVDDAPADEALAVDEASEAGTSLDEAPTDEAPDVDARPSDGP